MVMVFTTKLRKKLLKNIAKASGIVISSIWTAEMNSIKVTSPLIAKKILLEHLRKRVVSNKHFIFDVGF